jgi:hypothetical protein
MHPLGSGFPNRAYFIERHAARLRRLGVLTDGHAGYLSLRNSRVVDEETYALKLLADSLHSGGYRSLVRLLELDFSASYLARCGCNNSRQLTS